MVLSCIFAQNITQNIINIFNKSDSGLQTELFIKNHHQGIKGYRCVELKEIYALIRLSSIHIIHLTQEVSAIHKPWFHYYLHLL